MKGYNSPLRLDSTKTSGGLLVYINENIPSKILNKFKIPSSFNNITLNDKFIHNIFMFTRY